MKPTRLVVVAWRYGVARLFELAGFVALGLGLGMGAAVGRHLPAADRAMTVGVVLLVASFFVEPRRRRSESLLGLFGRMLYLLGAAAWSLSFGGQAAPGPAPWWWWMPLVPAFGCLAGSVVVAFFEWRRR